MEDTENDYVISRLKNITGTAEGSNLPPRFIGGIRVPVITGLKIVRSQVFNSTNIQYQLIWNDAVGANVDHYNIYLSNTNDPKGIVNSPYLVKNSPAYLLTLISPNANSRNIITVQTVLTNGFVSSLSTSPSVVGGLVNFP